MASPVWYPRLDEGVRQQLLSFIESVLGASVFDPALADTYCGA